MIYRIADGEWKYFYVLADSPEQAIQKYKAFIEEQNSSVSISKDGDLVVSNPSEEIRQVELISKTLIK